MKCPLCKGSGSVSAFQQAMRGFEQSVSSVFPETHVSVQPTRAQPIQRTSSPARAANPISDVVVPFAQSVITGIPVLIASGALWDWRVGIVAGSASWFLTWQWLLRDHNAQLWRIEEIFNADIDGDGYVGEPQPRERQPQIPTSWIGEQPKSGGKYKPFKAPLSDWREGNLIAMAVLERGVPFTRRKLVAAGAFPDDPEHYSAVYNALKDAGLVDQGNLTRDGKAYFVQFLPPPLRRKHTPR